jgi:NAD(P)-dependent dehydrogenase (short-subunit alcohol dehydrogenase family)
MQLNQLKVIVTGAARGMGAHFATRLSEAGAQVAAGDVPPSLRCQKASSAITWT